MFLKKNAQFFVIDNISYGNNYPVNQSGCLYLGDINLKKYSNDIKKHLSSFFSHIGTIQIPHHGSKTDFDDSIFIDNIESAIVSCSYKQYYGHPSIDVIENVVSKGVHLHQVTECQNSIVIQTK